MKEITIMKLMEHGIQVVEEKLMDIIELANQYSEVSVPIFEENINAILTKIENLTRLQ